MWLSRPFSLKSTLPFTSANSVWSVPTPTPMPAFIGVPRWRTRMLPASTDSPPNFFTPRRLLCDSRPLRVLPPAFLCAMADYSLGDGRDLDQRVLLAMIAGTLVVLAATEFDDDLLVALAVAFDGR